MNNSSVHWPTNNHSLPPPDAINAKQLINTVKQYIRQEKINDDLNSRIEPIYLPMAQWLINKRNSQRPLIIGINGAQGSGKSTLADILQLIFQYGYKLNVVKLSIDDLYLGKQAREKLAQKIHPLLNTRGVPGTHDINLGLSLFDAFHSFDKSTVDIPRFDKSTDDRLPPDQWDQVTTPIDIILFEGWCVGARPQAPIELKDPVNELEASHDNDLVWRSYVNEQLAGQYQALFKQLDILITLSVPSIQQTHEWRELQESKLMNTTGSGMSQQELKHFIMHYERLTRHQLREVPERADVVLSLDQNHQIAKIRLRNA